MLLWAVTLCTWAGCAIEVYVAADTLEECYSLQSTHTIGSQDKVMLVRPEPCTDDQGLMIVVGMSDMMFSFRDETGIHYKPVIVSYHFVSLQFPFSYGMKIHLKLASKLWAALSGSRTGQKHAAMVLQAFLNSLKTSGKGVILYLSVYLQTHTDGPNQHSYSKWIQLNKVSD